jgi:hypothetical protein
MHDVLEKKKETLTNMRAPVASQAYYHAYKPTGTASKKCSSLS